jgi:hypothetical protein
MSISALRSGLLVSSKFVIEISITQAHRLGAGKVNFSLAHQSELPTKDEARRIATSVGLSRGPDQSKFHDAQHYTQVVCGIFSICV